MSPLSGIRVGVVSYLNMLPLIHGMDGLGNPSQPITVVRVPPAPMARMMDQGELDIGMLPVGAVIGHPDWKIVGRSMIGSNGPVKSVLVIGKGNPESWKVIHPDSHSRTSNVLAQIILDKRFGRRVELASPIPPEGWSPPDELRDGEAFVLIGTRALQWRHLGENPEITAIDLGECWTDWTGLPFIFAVWTARHEFAPGDWLERFEALKHGNQAHLEEIVRQWPGLGAEHLSVQDAVQYLTQNIKFDLTEEALAGMARFYEEGQAMGFFKHGWTSGAPNIPN